MSESKRERMEKKMTRLGRRDGQRDGEGESNSEKDGMRGMLIMRRGERETQYVKGHVKGKELSCC